jgi:arylsulfatase A-like enzyme
MKNSSQRSVAILVAGVLLLLVTMYSLKTVLREPPNVVFVMIDSLRADAISAINPDARYRTTGFDKLAELGALFTNARSQGPATLPSTYSFLSGKYPSEIISQWRWSSLDKGNAAGDPPQDSKKQSFLDMVKAGGYKVDLMTQGFRPDRLGFSIDNTVYEEHPKEAIPMNIVDQIIEYVTAPHDGPYFLFSVIFDPHTPWNHGDCVKCEGKDTEEYYTEVQLADNAIGKLTAQLDKLGFFNNNILILVADHGVNLGEHKVSFDKDTEKVLPHGLKHGYSAYNELTRVPLIIVSPDTYRKNFVIPELVEIRGLGRTISTLLKIPLIDELENDSGDLTQYFSSKNKIYTRPVISEGMISESRYFDCRYNGRLLSESKSIIMDGFKLINNLGNNSFELYHLQDDPKELVNLVDEYPEKALSMYRVLQERIDLTGSYHLPEVVEENFFHYLNEELEYSPALSDGLEKASGEAFLLAIVKEKARQGFKIVKNGKFELFVHAKEVFGKDRKLEFFLDDEKIGLLKLSKGLSEELQSVAIPLTRGEHFLSIVADGYVVPDALVHNGDKRKIYGLVEKLELTRIDGLEVAKEGLINVTSIYSDRFEDELNVLNLIDRDMGSFWPLANNNTHMKQITFKLDENNENKPHKILLLFNDNQLGDDGWISGIELLGSANGIIWQPIQIKSGFKPATVSIVLNQDSEFKNFRIKFPVEIPSIQFSEIVVY